MTNIITDRTVRKNVHHVSGLILAVFIGFHLLNQLFSLAGPDAHIELMENFRKVYRHPVIESLLLAAVVFQIVTGATLVFSRHAKTAAERIQLYSGLYLSFFLLVHVCAVLSGRYVEHLDTNFYYAGVGLNYYPATFFFIPYYFLAVASISLHIASLHYLKTRAIATSFVIAGAGVLAAVLILIGYTDAFRWRGVPPEYVDFIRQYFG